LEKMIKEEINNQVRSLILFLFVKDDKQKLNVKKMKEKLEEF
jgi:hypothetical protein